LNLKFPLKYSLDFKIILVAALYYLAARLGFFFAFENSSSLPTWPPSGVAFALVILLGRQTWPGITIGSLVANIMAHWNNPDLPPQTVIILSSLIAASHTLEAVVGNYLIKNWIKSDYPFKSTKNAYQFLFVSLTMSLCGATLGTLGLFINKLIDASQVLRTGFSWWIGNVVGILLFTPFLLACAEKFVFKISSKKTNRGWNFYFYASRNLSVAPGRLSGPDVRTCPTLSGPSLFIMARVPF
jgi:integral membrane sensor domain MASE1